MAPPDMIFVNGTVLTIDPHDSVADAVAVTDGVITAVGGRAEIEASIGRDTRVVDLEGGTLLPGINDSHIHAVSLGYAMPPLTLDLNYPTVESIADVVDQIRLAVMTKAPGEWITGNGWDTGFLDECLEEPGRQPTRHDLDGVAPDNPVFLQDFSYHSGWVNTATLRLAGIDPDGDYRDDEMIVSGPDGRPTGMLYERAQREVLDMVPEMSREQRELSIRSAMAQLSALGVTSITEPGLGPGDGSGGMGGDGMAIYRELLESGYLDLRVSVLLFPSPMSSSFVEFRDGLETMAVPTSPDERMFRVLGSKILADGIPPNKTAFMHEPYVDGGVGALTIAGDTDEEREVELRRMIDHAHDLGHQIGIHVTGDRAADIVIDAYVAAMERNPRDDPRHYVIHADFLTPWAMTTCAEHGIGVNMNPTIKWTIADLEIEFVGPERAAYEWPYRDTIDAGCVVSSSSDAPVTFPDWRQGVSTMILRESKASGAVSGADQCISLTEALRTYTVNAAWQDFAESWKGSLEVGKVADLCVLGGDLLHMDPHDIPGIPVSMTVLGGRVVFESSDFAGDQPPVAGKPVAGHFGPHTGLCEWDRWGTRSQSSSDSTPR